MVALAFCGPTFLSPQDEATFFAWLTSLSCVTRVVGRGRELTVHLRSTRVSNANLCELIAVLYRYEVEMTSLAQLATATNRDWFSNPRSFWYARVFGSASSGSGRAKSKRSAKRGDVA